MKKMKYKSGYDITVECTNCHLILTTHTELDICGNWRDGTIRLSKGFCPVCGRSTLIATVSNEYYKPK
jgi:ribosomal protein S27AE